MMHLQFVHSLTTTLFISLQKVTVVGKLKILLRKAHWMCNEPFRFLSQLFQDKEMVEPGYAMIILQCELHCETGLCLGIDD